jgi:hypothetical protein
VNIIYKLVEVHLVISIFSLLLVACDKPISPAQAKSVEVSAATNVRQLSEEEIRKKYRNCSEGYYNGPLPGVVRYTKDDYLWVVSPEFAKRYCMPPEFIDTELKGALAIAYKPVQEGTEECGFGGQKEVCGRRMAHGFEIYFDNQIPIEGESDTKYNYRAFYMLPHSKHLLSENNPQTPAEYKDWLKERPGAQSRFKPSSWGIAEAKNGKIIWDFIACREVQYIDTISPQINYLSLECTMSMNGFDNPRRPKEDGMQFVLTLNKLNDKGGDGDNGKSFKDFAHVIVLPSRLVRQVEQVDLKGAEAFQHLIKQALPEIQSK